MTERERFEEWANSRGLCTQIGRYGGYILSTTSAAWRAWQAARAWRPIETAPKDGSLVWGFSSYEKIPYACCWDEGKWISEEYDVHPTHWQPLPPPPEGE